MTETETIKQMKDLNDLNEEELCKKFIASLSVIFNYAKDDVVIAIENKSKETLLSIRQALCLQRDIHPLCLSKTKKQKSQTYHC